ncbi:RNA polymerase II degradation factor 1 isoform X1 [Lactuca sativa]|uniref:RNA polymerase II degradation factor 1 isoform X1 n=2 Tax=Lactuca sativa TaxID=4236 RepID=UPI000CD926D4|nr:RNA polymerase II degradation factor 1 isoform X1 [Lactuca sativa]
MPSGAKKRKAAKKKKEVNNSSTTNPHQRENEASQDSQNAQDPSVEVENRADDSSEIKSKDANGEETNIEIETGEKPKSSTGSSSSSSDNSDEDSNEKKEVVLEPEADQTTDKAEELEIPPIVDPVDETKAPAVESSPETIPDEVVEPEVSPIVEPVNPVDPSLQEAVKVYDETKNEERQELVAPETPEAVEEQITISEDALKDEIPISSVDESVSKDVVELSTKDHADTIEHSDRHLKQAVVDPPPISLDERKLTSWTNCCGMFEVFAGSRRKLII